MSFSFCSCQFCDKRFQLQIAHQRHEKKHLIKTNESASFGKLQQNDDKHELTELGTSLKGDTTPTEFESQQKMNHFYMCPFCDKTFIKFELYNSHVQTHSGGNKQNDVNPKAGGKESFINEYTQI